MHMPAGLRPRAQHHFDAASMGRSGVYMNICCFGRGLEKREVFLRAYVPLSRGIGRPGSYHVPTITVVRPVVSHFHTKRP